MSIKNHCQPVCQAEDGNIFVMVFLAIVMIAALTLAIRGIGGGKQSISEEDMLIQASQTAKYGAELEQAVRYVIDNGASETEIRFAAPSAPSEYGDISTTPEYQVFSRQGGAAEYRLAPESIMAGSDRNWEFYGTTDVPGVGSDKAELLAVLPNVTEEFCAAVNRSVGLTGQPDDLVSGAAPDCVESGATSRFGPSAQFDTSPNTLDPASFNKTPATQACVTCGGTYNYYYVLMSR